MPIQIRALVTKFQSADKTADKTADKKPEHHNLD